jgi:predicted NodU family carbamoyl transferase
VRGESNVFSAKDAFYCFMGTGLNILVCKDFILYNDKKKDLLKDCKKKI